MTFMRKFMDMLKMDNSEKEDNNQNENEKQQILSFFQSKINFANNLLENARKAENQVEFDKYMKEIQILFSEFSKPENQSRNTQEDKSNNNYPKYYENIEKQRESNLNISYEDVMDQDNRPFDLKAKFISDGNFTAIELFGENLKIAYRCFEEINNLLFPYKNLYEDIEFPKEISTEYIYERKLPESHLRCIPYTATKRKSKYPLCLWLSNSNDYGTEYIYAIYFDRNGNIGQGELSFHGIEGVGISYETKVRRDEKGLYILRISKNLYSPPYGTTTIYHHNPENDSRRKIDSEYDLDRFARECNAYAVREDRKQQNIE